MFACGSKPFVRLSKPAGASEVTAYSTGTASTTESASPRVTRRLLFDCCLAMFAPLLFEVNPGHRTREPRPSPAPAVPLPDRWTADPSHACRGCKMAAGACAERGPCAAEPRPTRGLACCNARCDSSPLQC